MQSLRVRFRVLCMVRFLPFKSQKKFFFHQETDEKMLKMSQTNKQTNKQTKKLFLLEMEGPWGI